MHCTNCSKQISDKAEICPDCGVRVFKTKHFCHNCGHSVNENQDICVDCGVSLNQQPQNHQPTNTSKEPWLIGILSFLITGLGQIVLGQTAKGITMLVASVVLSFLTAGLSILITVPISVIDGVLIANKQKEGKPVQEWEFF